MNALSMRAVRAAGGLTRHVPCLAPPPAKKGRKKTHVPDPIKTNGETAAEELRLLLERLEKLHEERKGISDDIADVLAEAKARGYDPASIEAIRKIRLKDRAQHQEATAILEIYMHNLGML